MYTFVYLNTVSTNINADDNRSHDISENMKTIFAKKFYIDSEAYFAKILESVLSAGIEQKIQNGKTTPLTSMDKMYIRHEIIEFLYWSVVDSMICQEETLSALPDTDLLSDAIESLEKCRNNRRRLTQEMHSLINRYVLLDRDKLNISTCLAKSEMSQMEQRYPPYDWMKIEGYAPPRAYDAKIFLECAKAP
jgi:hypothetical protein